MVVVVEWCLCAHSRGKIMSMGEREEGGRERGEVVDLEGISPFSCTDGWKLLYFSSFSCVHELLRFAMLWGVIVFTFSKNRFGQVLLFLLQVISHRPT